jgi:hypothetical protein
MLLLAFFARSANSVAEGIFTYVPLCTVISVFFAYIPFEKRWLDANGDGGNGRGHALTQIATHNGGESGLQPQGQHSNLQTLHATSASPASQASAVATDPFIIGDDEDPSMQGSTA